MPARGVARSLLPLLLGGLAWLLGACAQGGAAARGPYPQFAEYEDREVRQVRFVGDLQLPADSLQAVITTHPTRCRLLFLPLCIPFTSIGRERYQLDLQELALDVTRLQLYYRDHGYYGTRVQPSVDPLDEDKVAVRFAIAPGDQVILADLAVDGEGVDTIIPPEQQERILQLREGEPFGRLGFLRSADTLRAEMLQRGHAYADVLRNYSIDTIADVAEAQFTALPGPLVYVDSIVVEGADRLGERTIRRQLSFREGELFRGSELNESQRNIYSLEMVNFASVQLAPDTLQIDADSARATVLVRVVEAAQYQVETSAGFGTVDCLRTGARWTNRNFLGGGRRLELSASLAKIGVGEPLAVGLENSLCGALRDDTLSNQLNYRVAAAFQQPRLLNTQNQLNVAVHAERLTELSAYLRESVGTQVAVVRGLDPITLLTTTLDVESGRTRADPVVLCVGFDTCNEEDLAVLQDRRWNNALSLGAVRDASRQDGVVQRGYTARGAVDWASGLLGSDNLFLRVAAEGSVYRQVRRGWVLAGNLRVGRFLRGVLGEETNYIPPERRFYAGGPNSVRGYARNALGPTAYVSRPVYSGSGDDAVIERFDTVQSATGGTQLVVGSVELRTPSPIASDLMRLAYFVDAGQVSAPGSGIQVGSLRVTPGFGFRFVTPVGPFRLDLAYNPYGSEAGPLYQVDASRGLLLIDDAYEPDPPSFWRRFRVNFAVGQAF